MRNFEEFNFYFLKESDGRRAMLPVSFEQAIVENSKGFDVYWTVNEFDFGKRKIEDLKSVRYLYADFDNIAQEALEKNLEKFVMPSFVIKTRSGFHVYWELEPMVVGKDGTAQELAEKIRTFAQEVLVPLGADPQAKDVCRLLRPHMMRYWKDSKNNLHDAKEIWTEMIFESTAKYSFKNLERLFLKDTRHAFKQPRIGLESKNVASNDLWVILNRIPVIEALNALSGKQCVNGEIYSFRKSGNTTRIIVNQKPSNAWIDEKGNIGSTVGAGPTIVNWLKYFNHDMKTIASILKQEFNINT